MKSNQPNLRRSHSPTAAPKRSSKPVISLEERKRQKQSLKSYFIGGGNDAS